jgi:hypothetical protein
MPHFGQFPGLSLSTPSHIGQKNWLDFLSAVMPQMGSVAMMIHLSNEMTMHSFSASPAWLRVPKIAASEIRFIVQQWRNERWLPT